MSDLTIISLKFPMKRLSESLNKPNLIGLFGFNHQTYKSYDRRFCSVFVVVFLNHEFG